MTLPPWAALRLLKLAGVGVAAIALIWFGFYFRSLQVKAGKLKAAESALVGEQQGRAADRATYDANLKADRLSREKLQADFTAIRDRFAAIPPPVPETLVARKEIPLEPGQTTCPDVRIGDSFRLYWNAAATP